MSPQELEQPKRGGTLRQQLVETLRSAVMSGQIRPGSRLVELQLAEQLGVSRGPLREAVRQLVEEGLVDQVPYKGTVVKSLSMKDVEEVYSFRTILESFAFERVWEHRAPEFTSALDARHDALLEAIEAKDRPLAIAREMDLHGTVYEYSGHRILLDSWRMLRGHLHLYFNLHQAAHDRAGPLRDAHVTYVELAKGDDLAAMRSEIEEHMQRGLQRLSEFVERWDQE